jgi:hypothetical protein
MEAFGLFSGALCMGLATLVACLNFSLSFIRPLYFKIKKAEYHFVSGLPGIGTIFLIFAGILLPKSLFLGYAALLIICLDTGGLPWFIVVMAYQWFSSAKK